eukprot:15789668-Heterocapsa_arctica.AAC.1
MVVALMTERNQSEGEDFAGGLPEAEEREAAGSGAAWCDHVRSHTVLQERSEPAWVVENRRRM